MDSLIKKLLEIATGKKAKIFWAVILTIIVLLLALYPYIVANFLVFGVKLMLDILAIYPRALFPNTSCLLPIGTHVCGRNY